MIEIILWMNFVKAMSKEFKLKIIDVKAMNFVASVYTA